MTYDSTLNDRPPFPPSAPLNDPGQLLANLPAIFGFYPQESLVLAAFERHTQTRYILGPVIRLDLDDADAFQSLYGLAGGHVADFHADLVLAFIITGTLDDAGIDGVVDQLLELEDFGALSVDACWTVGEVLTGERYRLLFGPRPENRPGEPDSPWGQGRISDIALAQAMQPWIEQGRLPELTRVDAAARFARLDPEQSAAFGAEELAELEAFAHRVSEAVCGGAAPADADLVPAAATDFDLVLAELADTGASFEEVVEDADTLTTGAIVLAHTELRDICVVSVLARAEAASVLLLAVAKRFGGAIRANALSLYALAMVRRGLPMVARPALVAAQSDLPGHSLSALLLQAYQHGLAEQILHSVETGSRHTRQARGIEDVGGTDGAA